MFKCALGLLNDFAKDARGATAVEYALIATGIALAVLGGITAVGAALGVTFNDVGAAI